MRPRFRGVVDAGWDLVIIDEGPPCLQAPVDEVARYRLAAELAAATPHVLLLSATPHSGKSDGFRRFLGLLDDGFSRGSPVRRDTVAPHVARTEKRQAVDQAGGSIVPAAGDDPSSGGPTPNGRPSASSMRRSPSTYVVVGTRQCDRGVDRPAFWCC